MAPERRSARMQRVGHAVQQVVADELELIDDERLELVTITGARVDPDLSRGLVWFSSLVTPDDEVVPLLGEHRVRLQAAIARQLRLKRTPELRFEADPAISAGSKVEEILRDLHTGGDAPSA